MPPRGSRAALPWILAFAAGGVGCGSRAAGDLGFPLTTRSETARRSFAEGLRQFDLLHMTAAVRSFDRAIQADPDFALARAYRALGLNSTGDAAGEMAKAANLAARAGAEERLALQALQAWSRFDREAAVKALSGLVEAVPGSAQARLELGIHCLEMRRYDEAVAHLQRARELDPRFAPAPLFLARALSRAGKHEPARSAAAEAVALLPGEALAQATVGDVRIETGDCDEAIAAFTRALELDAGFVPAYERRAYCHRVKEDFRSARRDYETAFEKTAALPDGAYKELMLDWTKGEDLSFEIALTYLLAGNVAEAEKAAKATIEYCNRVRPQNAAFYYDALGRIYLENGRLDHALAAYRDGNDSILKSDLSGDDRKLWTGRYLHAQGRIAARARRFTEAFRQAEAIERLIEDAGAAGARYRQSLHYLRGYVFLEQRDYDRALAELRQADGEDPFIQWLLARAHRGAGDETSAEALITGLRAQKGGGFRYALVRNAVKAWVPAGSP